METKILERRKLDQQSLTHFIETAQRDLIPSIIKKQRHLAELFFTAELVVRFTAGEQKRAWLTDPLPLDLPISQPTAAGFAETVFRTWGALPVGSGYQKKQLFLALRFENLKNLPPNARIDLSQTVDFVLDRNHVSIEFTSNSSAQTLTHYYNEPFTEQEIKAIADAIFRPVIEGIRAVSV